MASSDDDSWEKQPESEDSEDGEFVPEAPPDPAAIRAAYAREQAQAQAPRAAPDPDPDDETLDDLRAKAAASQEEAAPPAPAAPATTGGTATNGAAAPATTADAAYSFVELPAPQHKDCLLYTSPSPRD